MLGLTKAFIGEKQRHLSNMNSHSNPNTPTRLNWRSFPNLTGKSCFQLLQKLLFGPNQRVKPNTQKVWSKLPMYKHMCFINIQPLHNVRSTQLWQRALSKVVKGGASGIYLDQSTQLSGCSECNPQPLLNIRVTGLRHGWGCHRVTPKTNPWSKSE